MIDASRGLVFLAWDGSVRTRDTREHTQPLDGRVAP